MMTKLQECWLKSLSADVTEALEECEEYFDNRADADCDQDGFIPNKEMLLLSKVKAAMKAFDELQGAA